MVYHTAHTPAWLPSKHARAGLIAPGTAGTMPVDVAANTEPCNSSKQAAFTAFVALCSSQSTPPIRDHAAAASAHGDDEETDVTTTTTTTPSGLSSSWSAPPVSKRHGEMLDSDASVASSPRWDGWSFKRQGRLAEQQHAQEKQQEQEELLDSLGNDTSAADEEPVLDSAALAELDGGLSSSDASDAEGDREDEADDNDDEKDDDDGMFVMEDHTVSALSEALMTGRSATALATLCEYSMLAASTMRQLGNVGKHMPNHALLA